VSAVRAEWTKARTLPSTPWLLMGLVALTVGVGALAAGTVNIRECADPANCGEDFAKLSLAGLWLSQAVAAVLGVLVLGNEYGTRMITVTVAAVPARLAVLAGKAVVVLALVVLPAVPGVIAAVALGRTIFAHNGFPLPDALTGASLRASAGTVLFLALVALLAFGVTAVVRDTAGALSVVLALLYATPALALVVSDPTWHERLQKFSPLTAGMAIQATTNLDALPIGPWPGLGVLAAWTAAALLAGTISFLVRDT
jgi:ABC-2 type transport system permease protein